MKTINGKRRKAKTRVMNRTPGITKQDYEALGQASRLALIGQLIPLGLTRVQDELQMEVAELAGNPYEHQGCAAQGVPSW